MSAEIGAQESTGQILGGSKRILSPELLNQRQRIVGSTNNGSQERNFNMANKESYNHQSHHPGGIEPARRSENSYHMNNALKVVKNSQNNVNTHPSQKLNSSQQNMIMNTGGVPVSGGNTRGSGFMNLSGGVDPLHQAQRGNIVNVNQLNKSLKNKN